MMGPAYAMLQLRNPKLPALLPISVRSLADTGALHLCVPAHVALQLQPKRCRKGTSSLLKARRWCVRAYVGPVEVPCNNRHCFTGGIALGDEVLGAVPMEDMDLVVQSAKRTVAAKPGEPQHSPDHREVKSRRPSGGNRMI